ncbi:hypothetical protein CAMGR0001_2198 [Campylobacter gracilis RM3268]|uniref:Uncharacterized protein n=1 Tax=Campylobacter gracilis RM3268 TaxID=553220 RepID=C8PH10_9BACT|nr:hypothetical protein CAMGR0001_2198 [Campylobacter gracilis RM3268]
MISKAAMVSKFFIHIPLLRLGALLNLYFSRGLNAPPVFKF